MMQEIIEASMHQDIRIEIYSAKAKQHLQPNDIRAMSDVG
jgi:hypothetical protein